MVWSRQQWRFFGIALVSLPALHWHRCQHQAVLVREDVVAELILMANPLYRIMSVAI
jgi:hypothetical protein